MPPEELLFSESNLLSKFMAKEMAIVTYEIEALGPLVPRGPSPTHTRHILNLFVYFFIW